MLNDHLLIVLFYLVYHGAILRVGFKTIRVLKWPFTGVGFADVH